MWKHSQNIAYRPATAKWDTITVSEEGRIGRQNLNAAYHPCIGIKADPEVPIDLSEKHRNPTRTTPARCSQRSDIETRTKKNGKQRKSESHMIRFGWLYSRRTMRAAISSEDLRSLIQDWTVLGFGGLPAIYACSEFGRQQHPRDLLEMLVLSIW